MQKPFTTDIPSIVMSNNLLLFTLLVYIVVVTIISLFTLSGSPSVTSLRYDSQSRTFTCTSTGGPATNVTWRKNGAVITPYQQTKRLTDNSTATYQIVLTINSSVSQNDIVGTYNCTVENNRGTSSMTMVISSNGELILEYMHILY